MLILPIETHGHRGDMLVIVLDEANIERMRAADPAEVKVKETGKNLVNPRVLVCFEKDDAELMRLVKDRDLMAIMEYLSRGFQFRPELGDHDNGPEKVGGDLK